ncbi:MAG: type II toxin-antitoxin system RelE/ParE family toxin [Pseudomonadota bacterium]
MIEVIQSAEFATWADALADRKAAARIQARIRLLSLGNPGDFKGLGGGLGEMRIDIGPGYRLYCSRRGNQLVVLLCGGDKRTQQADIRRARKVLEEWK